MTASQNHLVPLGKDGPLVAKMGFGLMVLAGFYGTPPSHEEQFKLLDRAVELGATFWDTSDLYGDNEVMLGKWFKNTGKRNEIFLASKFGMGMKVKGDPSQGIGIDSSPENAKKCIDASLERLGVDHIDLYYVHQCNPEVPIESTMRALAEIKAAGKIKHIGLSNVSSKTLRRAHKVAPVAAVQTEYSPFDIGIEKESSDNLLQTCRELGVTVVAYTPLGRGSLTIMSKESLAGAGDSRVRALPRFHDENVDANIKLATEWKALADKKGCSSSQLALAWLETQASVIPIPGTKRIKYLEQNWASVDIELTSAEQAEIRSFVEGAAAKVKGNSVPDWADHMRFADTAEGSY